MGLHFKSRTSSQVVRMLLNFFRIVSRDFFDIIDWKRKKKDLDIFVLFVIIRIWKKIIKSRLFVVFKKKNFMWIFCRHHQELCDTVSRNPPSYQEKKTNTPKIFFSRYFRAWLNNCWRLVKTFMSLSSSNRLLISIKVYYFSFALFLLPKNLTKNCPDLLVNLHFFLFYYTSSIIIVTYIILSIYYELYCSFLLDIITIQLNKSEKRHVFILSWNECLDHDMFSISKSPTTTKIDGFLSPCEWSILWWIIIIEFPKFLFYIFQFLLC